MTKQKETKSFSILTETQIWRQTQFSVNKYRKIDLQTFGFLKNMTFTVWTFWLIKAILAIFCVEKKIL